MAACSEKDKLERLNRWELEELNAKINLIENDLKYFKDARYNLCFAVYKNVNSSYDRNITYIPCKDLIRVENVILVGSKRNYAP